MSKHTPGPWYVGTDFRDQSRHVYAEQKVRDEDGEEWHPLIAATYDDETTVDWEANARLIAAAPDLLEACKTFAEWLRREEEGFVAAGRTRDTPEGEAEWREWFYGNIALCQLAQDQAKAAIKKAEGKIS